MYSVEVLAANMKVAKAFIEFLKTHPIDPRYDKICEDYEDANMKLGQLVTDAEWHDLAIKNLQYIEYLGL